MMIMIIIIIIDVVMRRLSGGPSVSAAKSVSGTTMYVPSERVRVYNIPSLVLTCSPRC